MIVVCDPEPYLKEIESRFNHMDAELFRLLAK